MCPNNIPVISVTLFFYVYAHFHWFKFNVRISECISMPWVRNYHRHSRAKLLRETFYIHDNFVLLVIFIKKHYSCFQKCVKSHWWCVRVYIKIKIIINNGYLQPIKSCWFIELPQKWFRLDNKENPTAHTDSQIIKLCKVSNLYHAGLPVMAKAARHHNKIDLLFAASLMRNTVESLVERASLFSGCAVKADWHGFRPQLFVHCRAASASDLSCVHCYVNASTFCYWHLCWNDCICVALITQGDIQVNAFPP